MKTKLTPIILPSSPAERRAFKKTKEYKDLLIERRREYCRECYREAHPDYTPNVPNGSVALQSLSVEERRAYRNTPEYKLLIKQKSTERYKEKRKQQLELKQAKLNNLRLSQFNDVFIKIVTDNNLEFKLLSDKASKSNNYYITNDGRVWSFTLGDFLSICYTNDGYAYCSIDSFNRHLIHRLVAEHFIPNPDNLPEVDHLNNIRDDNRVDNLRWCSKSDNVKSSFIRGRVHHSKKQS